MWPSPTPVRADANCHRTCGRPWGRGGHHRDQLGPFEFEQSDLLLHIAGLVEPECGHGQVVPRTELRQLALNQQEPHALGFEFRAHRLAPRYRISPPGNRYRLALSVSVEAGVAVDADGETAHTLSKTGISGNEQPDAAGPGKVRCRAPRLRVIIPIFIVLPARDPRPPRRH
jgi:hypothetical protein